MRYALALTVVLGLSTGGNAQEKITERDLSSIETAFVQDAVRSRLVDPDSAQFRMNQYRQGSAYYCATVNAKNRMGGYNGFKPFVVRLIADDTKPRPDGPISSYEAVVMDRGDTEGIIARAILDRCTKEGYRVSS